MLGLAALPFNQNVRTVFIGTSLGLYLGIALGFYFVMDRREQEGRTGRHAGLPGASDDRAESPVTRAVALRELAAARPRTEFETLAAAGSATAPLRLEMPVLRF